MLRAEHLFMGRQRPLRELQRACEVAFGPEKLGKIAKANTC